MKKVVKLILALLLIVTVKTVSASEIKLKYSDWSLMYPSGLDSSFVESELRYKWYKFENNSIVYVDEYHANLDGYIKDEGSEKTFYRYITNSTLLFNAKNQIVLDDDYCSNHFCYAKLFNEPTLVDTTNKVDEKYSTTPIYEYTSEVTPYTGDNIIYFIISLIVCSIGLFIVVKKKKKMSYE